MKKHTVDCNELQKYLETVEVHLASVAGSDGVKWLVKVGEKFFVRLGRSSSYEFSSLKDAVEKYNNSDLQL